MICDKCRQDKPADQMSTGRAAGGKADERICGDCLKVMQDFRRQEKQGRDSYKGPYW